MQREDPAVPVTSEESIEIAVGTHNLDLPLSDTPRLRELLRALPDWVTPVAWTSVYSSWIF